MLDFIKDLYHFVNPKFQNLFSEYPIKLKGRNTHLVNGHPLLHELINKNKDVYSYWINQILDNKEIFKIWQNTSPNHTSIMPTWNNGFFPALDMMSYYTIIENLNPSKIVEIGSGNSTKIAHASIQNNELFTKIISIDPKPRAEIDSIVHKIYRQPFEEIDVAEILELKANDILFIDNSHMIFPNSDAMVIFMEVLPLLKKGVIVHFHDIYLPFDYPQFMCDRFYSEQYGLAINLMANPKRYKTILPCYFVHKDETLNELLSPIWEVPQLRESEKHGGSFWLQIAD